eukprot:scaffold199569_cov44-Attheya_sp.AAC.1
MVRSLQILDPSISNCGTRNEWFQSAKDESAWDKRLLALDPPKPTDETDDSLPNRYCPTPEQLEDDDTSRTKHETAENHVLPFPPEFVPWNEDSQISSQTPTNSLAFHLPQIWGYGLYFPSNSRFAVVYQFKTWRSHTISLIIAAIRQK